jgi:type II secretory pathway component GspD/PulD (secretin)
MAALLTAAFPVVAQDAPAIVTPDGKTLPAGAVVRGRPSPGTQPMPVPGQPGAQPGKPAEKKAEGDGKPNDDRNTAPTAPDVVSRPDRPATPPDPKELLVRPNPDGMLQLNFTGQPWPDVLKWLAGISGLSFDWQELPGGYLNLVTQREYTVPESRNLINRHLLSRGYTLLLRGELMTVAKIENLDPALVPRVSPSDLVERDDYEFVKVSFPLRWILAEEATDELKPMLSPNGRLTALKTTNRLEAMDAVINLREMYSVLEQEQSNEGDERLVRPFVLKFARAEEVAVQLKELLGLKKESAPMNPQQMQQMQQMMQQRAQQNGGKGGAPTKEPEVSIVAVPRDNTILVNAPPDKMAVVEQAVEILDQRSDDAYSGIGALGETEVYRLSHIDPEQFIEMIHDMGAISPRTRIQPDKRRRAVIVTGSRSDHIIVEVLIRKLDSRTRTFHVIPLRKHDAEYVAGSIRFMMGEEKEEENQSSSRRSYFFFNPFGRSNNEDEYDDGDKFRVDADVEYNRLLLWCNEMEKAAVDELLVKLGEMPMPGGNPARRRVLNVENLEDAINLIEKLQQAWPNQGRNPLKIAPLPELPKTEEPEAPIAPPSPDAVEPVRKADPAARSVSTPPKDRATPDRNRRVDARTAQRARKIFEQPTIAALTDPTESSAAIKEQPAAQQAPRKVFRLLEVSQFDAPHTDAAESNAAESPASASTEPDVPVRKDSSTADDPTAAPAATQPPADAGERTPPAAPQRSLQPDDRLQRLLEQLRNQNRRAGSEADDSTTRDPAPIHVRVGADGQIYLESDDTEALDRFEELLEEYAPPRRDWHVFELKYPNTWAYGIEVILKDIFKEEMEEEESGGMKYSPFFGFYPGTGSERGPASLSRRKPLKIISDRDSHTILVQGASKDQLAMIEDLIAVYDKPTSTEPASIRRTKVIPIKYSKANTIAEAVKDVYRDLLSENDKALQTGRKDEKDRPADRNYTYIYGSGGDNADQEQEQPIRFKGLLSIGVDELSNNLVVSASQGLLDNVSLIVEALDEAARPNSSVQVIHLDSRVNARQLREKLHGIFGPQAKPDAKGEQNKNQPGQNGQPGQPQQPNANAQAQ